MEVKGNQNIFDFTLEKFGTLENLFDDVLVPNNLPVDGETQTNQEININAVGKGDDDVKMKISEQGLSMTNGDIPIVVEYRNGVVTDATEGETAIFDFEAKINSNTPVVFTVNWGTEVGTTTINSALVNGVWKALQTSIEIPLGVDPSQTILVTDNFGGSYSVAYTVEAGIPPILADGNTMFWVDAQENIIKDGSDLVSVWGDKSGNGNDLLQATPLDQPLDTGNGILFDGIRQFMETLAFTFNQPEQIYIVVKQVTWNAGGDEFFDGKSLNSGIVQQITATPGIRAYAGTASGTSNDLAINTFGIIRVLFNGANSEFIINEETPIIGNFGAANMGGFTLGSRGGIPLQWSNIQVKEIILRKIADTSPNKQIIYDYLANKY